SGLAELSPPPPRGSKTHPRSGPKLGGGAGVWMVGGGLRLASRVVRRGSYGCPKRLEAVFLQPLNDRCRCFFQRYPVPPVHWSKDVVALLDASSSNVVFECKRVFRRCD